MENEGHLQMRLTKVGPNKVQSDQGFVFSMPTPFQLHYVEGDHEVIIPGELLTGRTELLVSGSTIREWLKPRDANGINEEDRKRIIANVAAALEVLGIRYEFD